MSEEPVKKGASPFSQEVGAKETRKLRAQRQGVQSIWFGFGMFGLIGWSVVLPTLLGAALGIWLDEHHPGKHSWTLTLLIIGLFVGCLNAWHWVAREHRQIQDETKDKDE